MNELLGLDLTGFADLSKRVRPQKADRGEVVVIYIILTFFVYCGSLFKLNY